MITFSERVSDSSPPKHFKMFLLRPTSRFELVIFLCLFNAFSFFCRAYESLQELGIFKNLKAFIDTDKSASASASGYVVSFNGDELSRITGSVGTEIGQNDGSATAELVTPNIFGRGERLSINYSYSYIKATELNLKFLKPFYHTNLGDYKPE